MATALSVPTLGVARVPSRLPLRWTLRNHFTPGDHHDTIFARWLADDGQPRFSTLLVEHDEEGNLGLILTSGTEPDSDLLDALYDDVAHSIASAGGPVLYEVQTTQEVIDGCSHPYAKAMQAKGWTFAPGVVCSYCGEALK